ncbi:MAG: UbiA family prenyltransferase [Kiritimatiellae bacterium]|nr:UbiA family prenyltransferase [Kiritimatiellia bacterium]
MITPWLRLFRVPNLPTAIGDAVAGGAAVLFAVDGIDAASVVRAVLAAGAAELLLYMGGLADNDLVDEEADRAAGSSRPLATGALSRRAVRTARAVCFAGAAAVGLAFRLGAGWWACAAAVAGCVLAYDRLKERLPRLGFLLMGLCRGLAVASGAAAARGALRAPVVGTQLSDAQLFGLLVLPMVLGWTLYTAAVTRLGAGEERASAPLGPERYLPAAVALIPSWFGWGPLPLCVVWSLLHPDGVSVGVSRGLLVPFAGSVAAMAAWCAAVAPLGKPHGPAERGRAVGRAIGGLPWMQTGFLCIPLQSSGEPVAAFVGLAAACWLARLAIRRAWPAVTGS